MSPQRTGEPDLTRGTEVEGILWDVVTRLRARGWHISLWEIQRSQDVIAYLVARFRRAPTDDELRRHLRPVLCARESELATFDEIFRDSLPVAPRAVDAPTIQRHRRRRWQLRAGLAAMLILGVVAVLYLLTNSSSGGGAAPDAPTTPQSTGMLGYGTGVAVVVSVAAISVGIWWLAHRRRLHRRPGVHDPGHDLELRWAAAHPLNTLECVRMAKALRARTAEPGSTLDVRRTVDASVRAGLRLTPRFVQHKRAPEYLAVIEQRTTNDVLAAYHAKVVDQIGAHGVAIRRVGIRPRSQLVMDPVRGRRRLEAVQPTSERERVLLIAHDAALRDPLTGQARAWLAWFDRWSETTQIDPEVDPGRTFRGVDRVLSDVRCLDPAFARTWGGQRRAGNYAVPAVFVSDDELWIEPLAPPNEVVTRALDLLVGALGPNGWYWLCACALYPEIRYELTVSLGRLLRGDDGQPLCTNVELTRLARLPWFRYAYMPDWLRTTLISTMTHGQLVDARSALEQILVTGLLGAPDGEGRLSVAEERTGTGRRDTNATAERQPGSRHDQVYLDGSALRRRRLAAAAPRELVAAVRRHRQRFASPARAGDAPSTRVRRALAGCNSVLAVLAIVSTLAVAILAVDSAIAGDVGVFYTQFRSGDLPAWIFVYSSAVAVIPAAITLVFSKLTCRRRGVALGASGIIFLAVLLAFVWWLNQRARNGAGHFTTSQASTTDAVVMAILLAARLIATVASLAALLPASHAKPMPWATFQLRNRRAFLICVGVVVATTIMLSMGYDAIENLGTGAAPVALGFYGLIGAGSIVMAAAYFAGVRFIPLVAGAAVAGYGIESAISRDLALTQLVAVGVAALLVLAACYWQLRRVVEYPPPECWETRWRAWKWPLALGAVVVTALSSWIVFQSIEAMVVLTALLAMGSLLNLAADRFARVSQRYRLDSRIPIHFD